MECVHAMFRLAVAGIADKAVFGLASEPFLWISAPHPRRDLEFLPRCGRPELVGNFRRGSSGYPYRTLCRGNVPGSRIGDILSRTG